MEEIEKALLVAVNVNNQKYFLNSVEELRNLTYACNMDVLDVVVQNLENVNNATYIGTGKVKEIKEQAKDLKADLIIFNNELSPSQLRNLQKDLSLPILDRTGLILQIFSKRAQTKEAKLQVEVAKLQYMLPRLVGLHSSLGRQGSGAGLSNKGSGEKKLELDRRRIEDKITELNKELKNIENERDVQRKQRKKKGIPLVSLAGYTNAGKSTLMKMIAGLVEPSEGSIELFGNFVPQTERYRIGCVIESPALYAELTAKQNLEVFRKAYGLSSKESVQQILKQVGLSQYENKIVKKFSLGMKQRLAIGVALLGNPDFLILDEPINGLDPTGIQDMRNFLLKLNREEHITIMISSHILGELSKIATKYGIIKNGKLNEEITAKELNEKCQCCLKIKASDTAQAAILIEKNLHTKNYEILSDNNIRIFEYVDNPGIVNSLLVNHGISVDECTVTKESLEDYFNEKMRGGIVNA